MSPFRRLIDIGADVVRTANDLDVLQTLGVPPPELSEFQKVMEIASIVSAAKTNRIYVIFLVTWTGERSHDAANRHK